MPRRPRQSCGAAVEYRADALAGPQINWLLLISRQGKVRLAKWFTTLGPKAKAKITKDVTQLVLARRVSTLCGRGGADGRADGLRTQTRMCNFLEYKGEFGEERQAKRNAVLLDV